MTTNPVLILRAAVTISSKEPQKPLREKGQRNALPRDADDLSFGFRTEDKVTLFTWLSTIKDRGVF